jgi:hypothetical protein
LYFDYLLNGKNDEEEFPEVETKNTHQNIVTKEEVKQELQSMEKVKSGSTSGIVTEMITALTKDGREMLYDQRTLIRYKEEIPDDWKKGVIVPLYTERKGIQQNAKIRDTVN